MAAVLYESMNGIARITIHRPEARNAIDNEVVQGMQAAWQRFAQDADDRVAVLHGAGEQAFTSGADLKDMPRDIWLAMPNLSASAARHPGASARRTRCAGSGCRPLPRASSSPSPAR